MESQDSGECIKAVFRKFDTQKNSKINREKLVQVLIHLDPSLDRQALVNLLDLSDVVYGDDINYEMFIDSIRPPAPIAPSITVVKDETEAAAAVNASAQRGSSKTSEAASNFGDDEEVEQTKMQAQKTRGHRVSICAPKISDEQVTDYTKPVHPKDDAMKESLKKTLAGEKLQVLFGHLSDSSLDDVINAFYSKEFEDETSIITQGDDGDRLYVIAEGSVDIYVARPDADGKLVPGDRGNKVVTFGAGALFGELALMYTSPRAATVIASGPVRAWCLDALDFKMLLMKAANATYKKYEGWLSQVKLLDSLNHFELAQLADVMQNECFDEGEDIVVQGEEGDRFFILEDGTASCFITGDKGEIEVKQYLDVGDYFGEIALLTNEPRRATIRATGQGCSVTWVNKEDMSNLLGPIVEVLKASIDKYPEYAKFVQG